MALTLEQANEEIQRLAELYKKAAAAHIPKTIKEAEDQAWELEIPEDLAVALNVNYSREDKRHDRQRMIRLPVALKLLEDFEEGLISSTVTGPRVLLLNRIKRLKSVILLLKEGVVLFFEHVIQLISIMDFVDLVLWLITFGRVGDTEIVGKAFAIVEHTFELVRRYALIVLSYLVLVLGLPAFHQSVASTIKTRDAFAAFLRRDALPQRAVKRKWRRKVSRL